MPIADVTFKPTSGPTIKGTLSRSWTNDILVRDGFGAVHIFADEDMAWLQVPAQPALRGPGLCLWRLTLCVCFVFIAAAATEVLLAFRKRRDASSARD